MRMLLSVFALVLSCSICIGQDTPQPKVSKQDNPGGLEWLKQFEGEWKTDFDGTMHSRVVGERWIVSEISFQEGVISVQILGYDESTKKFVGTWVDATSNFIWKYSGSLGKDGKQLILEAQGPDFSDPTKMREYRDIYEFVSDDEITVTTKMLHADKEWKVFNEGKMTRISK